MASTYVNDLRLNEMATGDASGSWGTVTNTNLELIGEAFGYGTETIGNADTTITVADGAADPARSFYLKIASSADLTTTRIVTLAPNTVSKVWIIENATTGSQIITIKQGTGATINIPNGHVKMIASNGGGSGAIIYDLLTDLNVATNLFVKNAGTGDGSTANIYLQTAEADIAADDVIGKINFQAPNEGTGTDAILVSAAIQAISEGDFSSSSNATSLNFMTGASEAATTKMTLSSAGNLTVTGIVDVTDTTDASDATGDTGALRTEGGASIAKKLYVGTDLDVDGTTNLDVVDVDGAFTQDGGAVFNEDSADVDFRVESNGNANMLFVDGGNNRVGIGLAAPSSRGQLHVHNPTDNARAAIQLTSNETGSGVSDGFAIQVTINESNGDLEAALTQFEDASLIFHTNNTERYRIAGNGTLSSSTPGTSNFRAGSSAGDGILSGGNYNVVVGDSAGRFLTTGDNSVFVGFEAGKGITGTKLTGGDNVGVGYRAGYLLQGTASRNTIVGYTAADALTAGDQNTVMGYDALGAGVASFYNTAFGTGALRADTTGRHSVAVGISALYSQNNTGSASMFNTAVGSGAGFSVSTGTHSTYIGGLAGYFATTADTSTFIGFKAGQGITDAKLTGNLNTAVGSSAGLLLQGGATQNVLIGALAGDAITTAASNVGIGVHALGLTNTGASNTAIGTNASAAGTTAHSNVAVGMNALSTNGAGRYNVAVGFDALKDQNVDSDNYNTAVGFNSGGNITTGTLNTIVGANAGAANTFVASAVTLLGYNAGNAVTSAGADGLTAIGKDACELVTSVAATAVGTNALSSLISGAANTAVGQDSLTATTATNNTAIGAYSGLNNTSGTNNVFVGVTSGKFSTTAAQNTFLGSFSGQGIDGVKLTGNNNVAVGFKSGFLLQGAATLNTFVGVDSGVAVTTGTHNTLIGGLAGDSLTTGAYNIAVGHDALGNEQTGTNATAVGVGALGTQRYAGDTHNVAVGHNALSATSTGRLNTAVGSFAGDNQAEGSSNTYIGYDTNPSGSNVSHEIALGSSITAAGTNTVRIGTTNGYAQLDLDGSDTSWAAGSDERLKKDIANSTAGLSFIKDLRPVTFKWNAKNAIADSLPQYDASSSDPVWANSNDIHGFVAQEVKTVIDNHSEIKAGQGIWSADPEGTQHIAYGAMMPMMVKAVQELSTALDAALARIATLEG